MRSKKIFSLIFTLCFIFTTFASPVEETNHLKTVGFFKEVEHEPFTMSGEALPSFSASLADSIGFEADMATQSQPYQTTIIKPKAEAFLSDVISPVDIKHCLSDVSIKSTPTLSVYFKKRDTTITNSIVPFFDALPSFTIIECPSTIKPIREMEDSAEFAEFTSYVQPTCGTLTVSQDFFDALFIMPRSSLIDTKGNTLHFLKDVITLNDPITKKPILYIKEKTILYTPILFRALRVVPTSDCPNTAIILPTEFDYLIGKSVFLSMRNNEWDFLEILKKLPQQYTDMSFYTRVKTSKVSTLSVIIDKYLPLIKCKAVTYENWYGIFNILYSYAMNVRTEYSTRRIIIRWVLDRIFGDLLREHNECSTHPFLNEEKYTAIDLFHLFSYCSKNPEYNYVSIEAEKMIDRNDILVKEWLSNSVIRPTLGIISSWSLNQQLLLANNCQRLFINDFDFLIKWIRITLRSLGKISKYSKTYYEVLDASLNLLEALLNMINLSSQSNCYHAFAQELVHVFFVKENCPLTLIIFRIFKEKSAFLLPSTMTLNQNLIKFYFYGYIDMCSQIILGQPIYYISPSCSNDAHDLTNCFGQIQGKFELLRSSLYNVIKALGIMDTTIYKEGFNEIFSKVYCILTANLFTDDEQFLSKLKASCIPYYEGPSNLCDDALLSLKREDGITVLSERLLHSLARQSWSRSKEGIICFGILFETAKHVCIGDIESWKHALRMLVELINFFQPSLTGFECLSQIMRECHFCDVECCIPALEESYIYRFMRKAIDEMTIFPQEQTKNIVLTDQSIEIPIDLMEWARNIYDNGKDHGFDFDRYSREHRVFLTSVGHLLFGIPPAFLRLSSKDGSSLFEISAYLEYSLTRYVEFVKEEPNSVKQKFKVRFVDYRFDEYERFVKESDNQEFENARMKMNDRIV